jgi:hypothetical protein
MTITVCIGCIGETGHYATFWLHVGVTPETASQENSRSVLIPRRPNQRNPLPFSCARQQALSDIRTSDEPTETTVTRSKTSCFRMAISAG